VTLVFLVISIALQIFMLFMWARLILDLVRFLNHDFRPSGFGLVLAEATYAVTDPPIKLVRRVVPMIRIGNIALDLSWTIVMLVAIVLSSIAISVS
jgi:YggT family protein